MKTEKIPCEARQTGLMTPEIIERLENLFEFVLPNDLREYLIELYCSYVLHEHHSLPSDFKAMTESVMILMDFLKFVGEVEGKCRVNCKSPG